MVRTFITRARQLYLHDCVVQVVAGMCADSYSDILRQSRSSRRIWASPLCEGPGSTFHLLARRLAVGIPLRSLTLHEPGTTLVKVGTRRDRAVLASRSQTEDEAEGPRAGDRTSLQTEVRRSDQLDPLHALVDVDAPEIATAPLSGVFSGNKSRPGEHAHDN